MATAQRQTDSIAWTNAEYAQWQAHKLGRVLTMIEKRMGEYEKLYVSTAEQVEAHANYLQLLRVAFRDCGCDVACVTNVETTG